MATRYKLVCR